MQGDVLLGRWSKAKGTRLGRLLFSRAIGMAVPYSGTIRPELLELEPGRSAVAMADRRRVRNHLRSIHAIAMVNLGELSSGLALLAGLPMTMRGIVKGLEIDYLKKARGRLVARCTADIPETGKSQEVTVTAHIMDPAGDEVATVRVHWLVGPTKEAQGSPTGETP